jgi:hypothetical protein
MNREKNINTTNQCRASPCIRLVPYEQRPQGHRQWLQGHQGTGTCKVHSWSRDASRQPTAVRSQDASRQPTAVGGQDASTYLARDYKSLPYTSGGMVHNPAPNTWTLRTSLCQRFCINKCTLRVPGCLETLLIWHRAHARQHPLRLALGKDGEPDRTMTTKERETYAQLH